MKEPANAGFFRSRPVHSGRFLADMTLSFRARACRLVPGTLNIITTSVNRFASRSFLSPYTIQKKQTVIKLSTVTIAVGMLTLISAAAFAGTNDPVIQQREQNQQKRVGQRVGSGALTTRETGRLETRQARIAQNEARMKADGNLTAKERRKLTKEQNRASRNIYRKKHNDWKADVK